MEKISNSISVFVITTLEPFVKPLIGTATTTLGQTSQAVIDSHDQYEVWNDWNASDPTHSYLSKVCHTPKVWLTAGSFRPYSESASW